MPWGFASLPVEEGFSFWLFGPSKGASFLLERAEKEALRENSWKIRIKRG
jgi:hypothetical protein